MVIFQYARYGARRLAQYLHGCQILGLDVYSAAVQRGLRYGACAGLSLALSAVPAVAQITPDTLYTFTPGTTIRSAEVNFNFTELYTSFGDALNRTGGTMTGTLTAQVILPDGDNTRNFGSAAASWASAWFDGTVTIATASITTLTCTDCIALTTETSGNYVATITAGSGISGTVASEGATPTIALAALTADWSQTGAYDIVLANASSELKILESTGATYYGIFDVGDLGADATYTFSSISGIVTTQAAALTSTRVVVVDSNGQLTDDAGLTYSASVDTLFIGAPGINQLALGTPGGLWPAGTGLAFEGATSDDFHGILVAADPGANRTWTLPDATGTIYTSGNDPLDTIAEWQSLCTNCADIVADTTGTLTVARGGTGATSFTANGLLYGNTTSAVQVTAAGTSAQVLQANGSGVPTFVTFSGDATIAAGGELTVANDSHTHGAGNLTGTSLPSAVVTSSLTSVGTITTGTWNAGGVTSSGLIKTTYDPGSSLPSLHVLMGSAGTWATPETVGNIVFENDSTVTLTLATPDANAAKINFANNTQDSYVSLVANYSAGSETAVLSVGTVSTGVFTFTESGLTMANGATVGLGSGKGLIEFDDTTTDEVNILNANVGIGTSTPGFPLVVQGTIQGSGVAYFTQATPVNSLAIDGSSSSLHSIYSNATVDLSLGTNNSTSQLYLKSGGNVGIGDTSPAALLSVGNGDPFQVSTTGHTTISPSATTGTALTITHNGASAQGASFTNTGAADQVLSLTDSDGTCQAQPTTTGLTWSCSSDARLKTQIADASQSALAALRAIRIREFVTLANQEFHPFGVVAQELQVVDSTMVRSYVGSDLLYASTPSPWLMVRAIQELSAEVDRLQTRLAALERRP